MPNFIPNPDRLEKEQDTIRRMVERLDVKCPFCVKATLDQGTLTCSNCGTTMPNRSFRRKREAK